MYLYATVSINIYTGHLARPCMRPEQMANNKGSTVIRIKNSTRRLLELAKVQLLKERLFKKSNDKTDSSYFFVTHDEVIQKTTTEFLDRKEGALRKENGKKKQRSKSV